MTLYVYKVQCIPRQQIWGIFTTVKYRVCKAYGTQNSYRRAIECGHHRFQSGGVCDIVTCTEFQVLQRIIKAQKLHVSYVVCMESLKLVWCNQNLKLKLKGVQSIEKIYVSQLRHSVILRAQIKFDPFCLLWSSSPCGVSSQWGATPMQTKWIKLELLRACFTDCF